MPPIYKIRDWDKHFENGESRKIITLRWVATPNKHDGKGYRRLLRRPNCIEVFCAWNLILQVASKCPIRGVLSDENGPLTALDLADATGYPDHIFQAAFDTLIDPNIGWLELNEIPGENTSSSGQNHVSSGQNGKSLEILPISPGSSGQARTEGRGGKVGEGITGRGGEGIKDTSAAKAAITPAPPKVPTVRQPDPVWDTVAAIWFEGNVAKPHAPRVGKLVRDFKALGATADEIKRRLAIYREKWPNVSASPDALIKHWGTMAKEPRLPDPPGFKRKTKAELDALCEAHPEMFMSEEEAEEYGRRNQNSNPVES